MLTSTFKPVVAFAIALVLGGNVLAQEFESEIIIDGLNSPQGIHVDLYGNLYFTEVPSPGEFGADNTVTRYRLRNGRSRVVSTGEPYPTNIASDLFGNVYWSCQTAGVILRSGRFGTREPQMERTGLDTPVGLDVPLFSSRTLLFTEVPTPGVFGTDGGENTVKISFRFFRRNFTFALNEGDPEPSDVAIGLDGTVYWTCKTAGVILMRTPDGEVSFFQTGLESPVGLDVDIFGNVYWTEVPTPGIFGTDGGRNKVVRYNNRTGKTEVIREGDPEPIDVTVDLFGRNLYWTCKTAGVIIRAKL